MIKYSFVIPTYQNKYQLINTLTAIKKLKTASRFDYEVVVADDGSTDGTGEIIDEFKKTLRLKSVYLPRCEKSCRSRARNEALKLAEGEIIVFIDSDILVPPDYLIILDEFFSFGTDFAVSGFRKLINEQVSLESVADGRIFDKSYQQTLKTGDDFRYDIMKKISFNSAAFDAPFLYALSCNLAVPKRWIDKVGGFDEDLIKWGIEDIEFIYRLYKAGMRIIYNTRGTVLHQFHGIVEGSVIKKSQVSEVDYNAAVFIKKHPDFMGLDDKKVYELFHSIAKKYTLIERAARSNSKVINFLKSEEFDEVLEKVSEYSGLEDTNVKIFDKVGSTDLDIILGLMPKTKATFRYFPFYK